MLTRHWLVAAGVLSPMLARAQTLPGTIRIINPFPAGGTSDSMARLLQPFLQPDAASWRPCGRALAPPRDFW